MIDKIRLLITDVELPTWQFDDTYTDYADLVEALCRTILHHNKSRQLDVKIERIKQL